MRNSDEGLVLVFSDDTCWLNGERYKEVPLLLTSDGLPVEPPSTWFRHLAGMGKRRSGLKQSAYNLTPFLRWMSHPNRTKGAISKVRGPVSWDQTTDATITRYRSHCKDLGNADGTVNAKMSVVYRFFWWAQEHGYIADRIGNGRRQDGTLYPIQVSRYQVRGRWYITSDLLFDNPETEQLPIPTDKQIDDAFVRLAQNEDPYICVRNVTMFNWVLSTGIRRTELIQLTLAQLPDGHVAPRVDGRWPIKVVGKGGKTRTVYATDDLIAETRSYWDNERKSVLRSKTALSGPDQIFLSHTSGEPISARQVNRVFKDAFIDSTSKLHTHRVRAKFATDFVNENVDAEVEKVNGWRNVQVDFLLDALAQILGHCDKRTLRRYVQVRLRWHAQGFGKLERARGV